MLNEKLLLQLIDKGFDVNAQAEDAKLSLLHVAASNGNLPAVRILLAAGANANQLALDNFTPLMGAATSGILDVAVFLIQHGADPKAKTLTLGHSCLTFAFFSGTDPLTVLALAEMELILMKSLI